jgi:hypothetical protein
MQRLSDFADGQERAGSRLFDFQRLFLVSLNQPDELIQHRQCYLHWLAFGCLQGFDFTFAAFSESLMSIDLAL